MSDILIIAPTASYQRTQDQVPINDTIKDQTDAVNVNQKLNAITPVADRKAPAEVKFKFYNDMRVIHEGSQNADEYARNQFEYKEKTKRRNMCYYPVVDESENSRYIKGLSNT
jgi:hypothetical protein